MKVDKIYYYADQVTEQIAGYLKAYNGFRKVEFVPLLPKDLVTVHGIKRQFPITDEKAILIWGEGYKHHASYFFSPQADYFKSIDDAHADVSPSNGVIDSSNHNFFLLLDDPYSLSVEVSGCADSQFIGKQWIGPLDEQRPKKLYVSKPNLGSSFSGVIVHKSIDLDVVHGFPCAAEHSVGRREISLGIVRDNLEKILEQNNVVRLDIGGLSREVFGEWKCYADGKEFGLEAHRMLIETVLSYD